MALSLKQEVTLITVPGQPIVLELRVDGPDAVAGNRFEVGANGAPIRFDHPVLDAPGADPATLVFRSTGGFTGTGNFLLTVTDTAGLERTRARVHVVADPSVPPPRPPRPWMIAVRDGGKALAMGLLPIIGACALLWLVYLGCLRGYYWVQESKSCKVCPAPGMESGCLAGKNPDPCLVGLTACYKKQLAEDKK